ncbi:MAG: 2-C-methyl-D-erythritol 4-phosphate cytidylyltransferase [Deltaproteobacteria bacterium]|nr:2-C-methyl-D-erythritol 4-phosphate cytidylyltransferase [Deltaproteobacteria bacterium]MCL5276536.1 2-C-methyl-D-erythritol 4-phosphate cytidylyltransferase [Deltaproteobacteria bacterium]
MHITAIVPAAGMGTRLGSAVPKQFIELKGKPVLIYSLEVLDEAEGIADIIVSGSAPGVPVIKDLLHAFHIKKVIDVVEGGDERIQSVRNAFNRIGSADYVLIHDAVRPFITRGAVEKVIRAGISHGAAISAIPVTDTVKSVDANGVVVRNVDRRGLWLAQTPQVFRYSVLARAYEAYDKHPVAVTDESGMVESMGVRVKTVAGSIFNIKITKDEDLSLALLIARTA